MLDLTIETAEERTQLVRQILETTPPEKINPKFLELLANYIVYAKKQSTILTDNRLVTINKRETSYQGLCGKLQNGENGIYNMTSDLGKNTILQPKDSISPEQQKNIPALIQIDQAIERLEKLYTAATGKEKFIIRRQIIELRQDKYIIRNEFLGRGGGKYNPTIKSISKLEFYDSFYIDQFGTPHNDGLISFFNPRHLEALLCNYSALKESCEGDFRNDLWYLMLDLDNLIDKTLKINFPLYYDILRYKIDGYTNLQIQERLEASFNIHHSIQYISSLWRNKIPDLLAEQAQKDFLIWYYTNKERGQWKKCTRCHQIKLAHPKFFSKNKTSKDKFYSLCKDCRNRKKG